jgi:hypothetical protein
VHSVQVLTIRLTMSMIITIKILLDVVTNNSQLTSKRSAHNNRMQADQPFVTSFALGWKSSSKLEKAKAAPNRFANGWLLMLNVVRNFLNVKQIYLTNIGINVKAPFLYNLFANYNTIRYNGNHDKDV